MSSYLSRFQKMMEELKAHPDIQVVTFYVAPPATEEEILEVEVELDFFLEESIKAFYQEMNGLQIRWIHKKNPDYNPNEHIFSKEKFDVWEPLEEFSLPYDGYINMLPVQYMSDFKSWEYIVWSEEDKDSTSNFMNKELSSYELLIRMRPFDFFSRSESIVFYIEKGVTCLNVLLLEDDLLDPKYSRITNFQSYIEFLLATKGVCNERHRFYYEKRGHTMEQLITPKEYWTDKELSLDEYKPE